MFDSERGRRWNVYRLESPDTLVLQTVIDSSRLERDVRYALRYRRDDG